MTAFLSAPTCVAVSVVCGVCVKDMIEIFFLVYKNIPTQIPIPISTKPPIIKDFFISIVYQIYKSTQY